MGSEIAATESTASSAGITISFPFVDGSECSCVCVKASPYLATIAVRQTLPPEWTIRQPSYLWGNSRGGIYPGSRFEDFVSPVIVTSPLIAQGKNTLFYMRTADSNGAGRLLLQPSIRQVRNHLKTKPGNITTAISRGSNNRLQKPGKRSVTFDLSSSGSRPTTGPTLSRSRLLKNEGDQGSPVSLFVTTSVSMNKPQSFI